MQFTLENKKYRIQVELKAKMNVILGDSGIGKSTLTRYIMGINSEHIKMYASDDFNLNVLDEYRFSQMLNKSISVCRRNFKFIPGELTKKEVHLAQQCSYIFNCLSSSEKRLSYNKQLELVFFYLGCLKIYWSNIDNFPYDRSVIFIDDDPLIDTIEFATLFNLDKYNIYVSINRGKMSRINYSVEDRFIFKAEGKDHYLVKEFNYRDAVVNSDKKLKYSPTEPILIEDSNSGLLYFSNIYKNIKSSGSKDKILACLKNYENRKLFLILDMCAAGSLICDIIETAALYNIDLRFKQDYKK